MRKVLKDVFKNCRVVKTAIRPDWNNCNHLGYVVVTPSGEEYDVYLTEELEFILR